MTSEKQVIVSTRKDFNRLRLLTDETIPKKQMWFLLNPSKYVHNGFMKAVIFMHVMQLFVSIGSLVSRRCENFIGVASEHM